jgi:tryptophan synthase alpha chain
LTLTAILRSDMRIGDKFKQLKNEKRKAFIAYVPYGFPSISATKNICLTLQDSGVDIIELGIPFSDPLADGPIIAEAGTKALEKGANLNNFFKTLGVLRTSLKIPLVAMTYYNPILQFGIDKFLKKLNDNDVNALIVVDLPLEENAFLLRKAQRFSIDTILFATPVSSLQRIKRIVKKSSGFIYYISVTGITGPKTIKISQVSRYVKSIKKITETPVCVGFGIHKREQVVAMRDFSDGVIVGSSIVQYIDSHHKDKDFLNKLGVYVKSLCLK